MLPNWIGDVVMATPTLRAIRQNFPDALVVGIMRPYVRQVLEGTAWLDRSLYYDRRTPSQGLTWWQLVDQLRTLRLDTFILTTHSLRAGWLAWLSGATNRVGFVRNGRALFLNRRLYQRKVAGSYPVRSAIDHYLELAQAVGCPGNDSRMELATTSRDELVADRVWNNLGLGEVAEVIAFNTGSACSPARIWPVEYFVDLAQQLVTTRNAAVLIMCGPGEVATAAAIERAANHYRVTSMVEQDLSLGVAKACIRRANVLVTTDSGPRHFGPAFDVPVVALFGPIDPRWTDSHHAKSSYLQHPCACAPCGRDHCPYTHHACMREISPQRVYEATVTQLQRWPRRTAA
jgi:heptosyltransferase-2